MSDKQKKPKATIESKPLDAQEIQRLKVVGSIEKLSQLVSSTNNKVGESNGKLDDVIGDVKSLINKLNEDIDNILNLHDKSNGNMVSELNTLLSKHSVIAEKIDNDLHSEDVEFANLKKSVNKMATAMKSYAESSQRHVDRMGTFSESLSSVMTELRKMANEPIGDNRSKNTRIAANTPIVINQSKDFEEVNAKLNMVADSVDKINKYIRGPYSANKPDTVDTAAQNDLKKGYNELSNEIKKSNNEVANDIKKNNGEINNEIKKGYDRTIENIKTNGDITTKKILESNNENFNVLRSEILNIKELIRSTDKDIHNDSEKRIKNMQLENDKLKSLVDRLNSEKKQLDNKIEELDTEIQDLNDKLSDEKKKFSAEMLKARTFDRRIKELETEKESEVSQLTRKVTELRNENRKLETKMPKEVVNSAVDEVNSKGKPVVDRKETISSEEIPKSHTKPVNRTLVNNINSKSDDKTTRSIENVKKATSDSEEDIFEEKAPKPNSTSNSAKDIFKHESSSQSDSEEDISLFSRYPKTKSRSNSGVKKKSSANIVNNTPSPHIKDVKKEEVKDVKDVKTADINDIKDLKKTDVKKEDIKDAKKEDIKDVKKEDIKDVKIKSLVNNVDTSLNKVKNIDSKSPRTESSGRKKIVVKVDKSSNYKDAVFNRKRSHSRSNSSSSE